MGESDQDPVQLLAGIDLFAGLSNRQLGKLVSRARTVDQGAGHEVAHEGLGSLAFHLVLSGKVSVSKGGREIRELSTGEYFGEMSMIDGRPRSATVTAVEPTRTLVISHNQFQDLVRAEPEFALGLLKHLCGRLREVEATS